MDTLTADCCGEKTCWTMPPEFVRVRYFFGQRLGVMELTDEAAYHAGKQAFHNARAHGVGVLCGLKVDRYVFQSATQTTVLRVHRGGALDRCGREILVGADQCVDIAAWFATNKSRPELADWKAGTTQTLWVGLRYRECPSDPCAAPRDPCGCDNGGCEFGRVREGFELGLFTSREKDKLVLELTPFPEGLDVSLLALAGQSSVGSASQALVDAIETAIDTAVADGCPAPDDARWLSLAAVKVTLDSASGVPVDITDPNNTARATLLPTSELQLLLIQLLGQAIGSGALSNGPQPAALTFTADGPGQASGKFAVPVILTGGSIFTKPVPIVTATFLPTMVSLQQLDPKGGWNSTALTLGTATYGDTPPQLTIPVTAGLSAGPLYRLSIVAPLETPVVDELGRPLALPYVRTFTLVPDLSSNALQLHPAF